MKRASNHPFVHVLLLILLSLPSSVVLARHSRHHVATLDPEAPFISMTLQGAQATVAFSPRGRAELLVVNAINAAKSQILVQAYGFSNAAILQALAAAKARGVDVRVILDKSNDKGKYSGATYVANAGVPVWIDYQPSIAHNKVMVIDHQSVITGSFNFTAAAQAHNAENVLLLQGVPQLAAIYTQDWQWRQSKSRVYVGRGQTGVLSDGQSERP